MFRRLLVTGCVAVVGVAAVSAPAAEGAGKLQDVQHIVVIYEENHSFDNLYGGWEGVQRLRRRGPRRTPPDQPGRPALRLSHAGRREPDLAAAERAVHRLDDRARRSRATSPTRRSRSTTTSRRARRPARRRACSPPNGVLNGQGLPGGCTRDLVHRFYQEQYQLDGGAQNRYVTGSDAVGLTMGGYDTKRAADLPVPAPGGPPALRDRGQLLPGGVRRLVPEPPVAGRRAPRRSGRTR